MRVLIAGGGIGGLALACGLARLGITTEVYERDTDLSATGGYHLHLGSNALDALGALLAPEVLERILAASASGRLQGGDIVRDMRGRIIHESAEPDHDRSVNIDRIALRLILAEAAGAALRTGREVTGFERTADGVVASFSDGDEIAGDLLVGADGVHSRIAHSLAGGPTSTPVGLLGIAGRTPVDAVPPDVATLLGDRSGLAVGPSGTGLYIGYHDPAGQAAVAGGPADQAAAYIWGAVLTESPETGRLRRLAGPQLRDATVAYLAERGWSGRMTAVIAQSGVDGIDSFRFHAASPHAARLAPWPAGRVTALGDAVHAMPPTAGMGANTAIRDAAALARQLQRVLEGGATIPVAVHAFEHGMRGYGAAAVAASLRPVGWLRSGSGPLGSAVTRAVLPALAALASPRRRPAA